MHFSSAIRAPFKENTPTNRKNTKRFAATLATSFKWPMLPCKSRHPTAINLHLLRRSVMHMRSKRKKSLKFTGKVKLNASDLHSTHLPDRIST